MMMVLELAARGDLRDFLRDCRPTGNTTGLLTQGQLLKMCMDVANGMTFLASLQFVHRDLACRYKITFIFVLASTITIFAATASWLQTSPLKLLTLGSAAMCIIQIVQNVNHIVEWYLPCL